MQPMPGILYIQTMGAQMVDAYPFTQIWYNICTSGVAAGIQAKVEAITGVQGVTMALQNQPFVMMSLMPGLGFWVISGTDAAGMPINEYAGSLATRETEPNPFIDGKGGPNLSIRDFTSEGYSQVYWSA